MIQLDRAKEGAATLVSIVRINLKDKFTSDFDTANGILSVFTSQLTGKSQYKTPIVNFGANFYNDRFTTIYFYTSATGSNSYTMQMGTSDYPLGFYDVSIYQNSSTSNFDPAGLNLVYTGLGNVTATSAAASPTFTEYTTNDADTDSVYITLN
jgi:hypothetical protein